MVNLFLTQIIHFWWSLGDLNVCIPTCLGTKKSLVFFPFLPISMSLERQESHSSDDTLSRREILKWAAGVGVGITAATLGLIKAGPSIMKKMNEWEFEASTEVVSMEDLALNGITFDQDGFSGITNETIQGAGGFEYTNGRVRPTEGTRHLMFSAERSGGGMSMLPKYIALFDENGNLEEVRRRL